MSESKAATAGDTVKMERIGEFLRESRARNICILDVREMTSITDYFIICTVSSAVQARAIVRDFRDMMSEEGRKPLSRENVFESPWVLLDYGDFVMHIFNQEGREYYRLEKLWSEAPVVYTHEGGGS